MSYDTRICPGCNKLVPVDRQYWHKRLKMCWNCIENGRGKKQCKNCGKAYPQTRQYFERKDSKICLKCHADSTKAKRTCDTCHEAIPIDNFTSQFSTCDTCTKMLYMRHINMPISAHQLQDRGIESHPDIIDVLGGKQQTECVYFIEAPEVNRIKIGVSANVLRRLKSLQSSAPCRLALIGLLIPENALRKEKEVHRKFTTYRLWGEWFTYTDVIRRYVSIKTYNCFVTVDIQTGL